MCNALSDCCVLNINEESLNIVRKCFFDLQHLKVSFSYSLWTFIVTFFIPARV